MNENLVNSFAAKALKKSGLFISIFCLSQSCFAQIPPEDVVDANAAALRKQAFHGRFQTNNKPTTKSFIFNVAQLQLVLDEYKAAGVSEMVFVPALIRPGQDADRYIAKNPGLSQADRARVANKTNLLIKAPRPGSAGLKRLWFVDKYYDIARICPPPEPCLD